MCYVTAGAGHRRAAEAIVEAVQAQRPQAQVECVDVLDYTPSWFRHAYSWSYLLLVQHAPWVWWFSYTLLDHAGVFRWIRPLRRAWNQLLTRRFRRWLTAHPPAVVVAAHFLPADVCGAGRRAGWLRVPLVVVVTDVHPHRFWITPEADAIVVATEAGAQVCRQAGVPSARLQVLGIPIAGAARPRRERHTLEAAFQLQPRRRTVLVTSGGTTVGPFRQVVTALMELERTVPGRLQLLVVCGADQAAVRHLQARAQETAMPVRIFGFIDNMGEAMAVADLVVAKAGGMTLAEALGQGVPLILYHAIPGQEWWNARYVSQQGAAVIAHRPHDVAELIRRCLDEPAYLASMRRAAQRLSRPDAAAAIMSHVIQPLLNA